jgi:glycyl-tRNA synthetase
MEMEFFVEPGTDEHWHQYWIDQRMAWYRTYGIRAENIKLREHEQDELSHYSKRTVDIEYAFPWTEWGELEGIANRTDFDLSQHQKFSGEDLTYYDQEKDQRFIPYVIEPAAGADRATLAFLIDAYTEDEAPTSKGEMEKRSVLKLHHALAPYKVAVLPLSRNEKLVPTARELAATLRAHFPLDYDDAGAIGRRYRRQDEIGTPFAVTVDFDSLEDRAATVRDRDSMQQQRIPMAELVAYLQERLAI